MNIGSWPPHNERLLFPSGLSLYMKRKQLRVSFSLVYFSTCGAGPHALWLLTTKCPHGKHLWLSLKHQSTAKNSNLQLRRHKHPTGAPPQKDGEKDVENVRFAKENTQRRKGFERKPEGNMLIVVYFHIRQMFCLLIICFGSLSPRLLRSARRAQAARCAARAGPTMNVSSVCRSDRGYAEVTGSSREERGDMKADCGMSLMMCSIKFN